MLSVHSKARSGQISGVTDKKSFRILFILGNGEGLSGRPDSPGFHSVDIGSGIVAVFHPPPIIVEVNN
jgi:hypothetical protein